MKLTEKVNIKLFTALLIMLAGHILLAYFIKRESTYILFTAFAALFVLYYLVCKQKISTLQFYILIWGSIALRVAWLFAFPNLSDDYARFVWDGRLMISGHNPFKYLPSAVMKSGLPGFYADPVIYKALNSQTYYTCYPPLLQIVFAVSAFIFPHNTYGDVIILRLFNLAADIGSVYILIALCKKWKVDKNLVLLYALNPMVIAELTGNLHYEGMMIFFILLTIWCWENNKFWISVLFFTAAIITKLVPLMLLPLIFFYWKGKKGFTFCASAVLLTIVSFFSFIDVSVAHKFWTSIDSYFQESEFNASIYYLIRDAVQYFTGENKIEIIGPTLTLLSGLLIILYAVWKRKNISIIRLFKYFSWTMFIYYLFTTTVFPWYLTPIVAFTVFTGYKFPLVWSATIMLSYYADRNTEFIESTFLLIVEYTALALSIGWDIYQELNKNKTRILTVNQ